jgi:hypothetical protein
MFLGPVGTVSSSATPEPFAGYKILQQKIEKTGQIADERAVLNDREDVSGIMALAGLSRSAKASLQHSLDERRGRLRAPFQGPGSGEDSRRG